MPNCLYLGVGLTYFLIFVHIIKSSRKLTRQNLSTECHRFDCSIITLAWRDTKGGDIAKIMTGDKIRFPLLLVFCFILRPKLCAFLSF